MDDSLRVSETLYVGLCRHIGTPTEVTIRRELMDMEEIIQNSVGVLDRNMYSSSHREGFRLKSSDRDMMFWYTGYNIICDMSNFIDLYKFACTILMEHFLTPPGFVRLKLLTPTSSSRIIYSVDIHMNNCYISSTKFSYTMHKFLTKNWNFYRKTATAWTLF